MKEKCMAHHWIIDTPNGPISNGVCQKCGAEKEFKNYEQEGSREYFIPPKGWHGDFTQTLAYPGFEGLKVVNL